MSKIDFDRGTHLISTINENVSFIKNENITEVEDLKKDKKEYLAISMALFTVQNKLIELGEEIVDSLDKNLYAKKYLDVIDFLYQEKIIDSKMYKIFRDFIIYRNEIVHEYEGIRENEIFWCINQLDKVEEFIKIVEKDLI